MIRLQEDQLGLSDSALDDLFSYGCGAPTTTVSFLHPNAESTNSGFSHTMTRLEDGTIEFKNDTDKMPIDRLNPKLAGTIIGMWIEHEIINPFASNMKGSDV